MTSSVSGPSYAVAESLLLKAIDGLQKLETTNPALVPILKKALELIAASFSQIIKIKYGITAEKEVKNLSPDQVNALNASIAAVTDQINALVETIATLSQQIAADQSTLATYQSQLANLNSSLTAAQTAVSASQTKVANDVESIQTFIQGIEVLNNSPAVQSAFVALSSPPIISQLTDLQTAMVSAINNGGGTATQKTVLIAQVSIYINQAKTDVTQLAADQATVTNLTNQIASLQASINALTVQISNKQNQLQNSNTQLAALQTQLTSLQGQLQTAQNVLNQAIALYETFTPLEKQIFKELYPNVVFPS